jgi:uncharacterized membrane protein
MFGLTTLGAIHTAISLVALAAGVLAFIRHREIGPASTAGRVYIQTTVLTCLTGFGIFQHGGFGAPHALGVMTLLVLALATVAGRTAWLGHASPYVETVSYSLTFFFHLIPGVTETFTRLPAGAPLFTSPEDPALQPVVGVLFLLFVVGAALQVWRLRGRRKLGGPSRLAAGG